MLRFLSIRYRLMLLSLLLGVSLIVTSLVLLNQTRNQNRLIGQLSHNIDVIVKADRAIQTFGNLKYWLTDLALSQLMLSERKANKELERLELELTALEDDMPGVVDGVSGQLAQLMTVALAASNAYRQADRLTGNSKMAQGRAHILAVDSKLSALVERVRKEGKTAALTVLQRTEQGRRFAVWGVVAVMLVRGSADVSYRALRRLTFESGGSGD